MSRSKAERSPITRRCWRACSSPRRRPAQRGLTAAKAQPTTQLLFHERLIAGAGARGIARACCRSTSCAPESGQGRQPQPQPQTFLKGVAPQFFLAFPAGAQFAAYEFSKAKCAALDGVGAPAQYARLPALAARARATCAPSARRFCPAQSARWGRRSCACPRRCSSSACRLTSTRAAVGFVKMVQDNGVGAFYKVRGDGVARRAVERALLHVFRAGQVDLQEGDGRRADDRPEPRARRAGRHDGGGDHDPIDVVKTRLMTGQATGGIPGVLSQIVREEGAATLMKGVVPRVAFLAPLAALTLSFYEAIAASSCAHAWRTPSDLECDAPTVNTIFRATENVCTPLQRLAERHSTVGFARGACDLDVLPLAATRYEAPMRAPRHPSPHPRLGAAAGAAALRLASDVRAAHGDSRRGRRGDGRRRGGGCPTGAAAPGR